MTFHPSEPLPPLPLVPRRVALWRLLLRASHPEPAFAVTAFAAALAVTAGRGAVGAAAVAAAVFAGQLSVGWCNDALDAGRDRDSGRRDKPVAAGELSPRTAGLAAVAAFALCVPLSLLGGAVAGAVHLTGVVSAWTYNLLLKRTVLSPLPYAVSFGALPAFVTLGPPDPAPPAWWATAAAALLGLGAHVANVLPDIEDDLAAGVRGLPQRLGRPVCRWVAPTLMLAAVAVLTAGPPGAAGPWVWAPAATAAVVAFAGTAAPAGTGSRRPFRAAMAVAAVAVLQLLLRGADMT
ncbi:UbiA family prenyltransferase [Streptomyces fragilis]|uniref:UbiA family prenyltransferase n=1 Tax=Streptomyces fragilis TaxID=67301 RepID=A0ABV2YRH8_9ACTN|nr:UbiA family prenyltransferase [Streptomyces fragilis]